MSYRELIEKIAQYVQAAIRGKMRSDVFCVNVGNLINEYKKRFVAPSISDQSVFAGSRPEDHRKLHMADDGLTPEEASRLELADDEGRNILDDGDAFE